MPGWAGFYVGINGGYAWQDPRVVTYTPNDQLASVATCGFITCVPPGSFGIRGGFGGGQAGYNWQLYPFVVGGVEADFDGSSIRGSGTSSVSLLSTVAPGSYVATEKIDWFGTVRARLGLLPVNSLLLYGTGGFAYGEVNTSAVLYGNANQSGFGFGYGCTGGSACFAGNQSQTAAGWTAGFGAEFAVTNNVTIKAEYLYVDLDMAPSVRSAAPSPGVNAPSSFTAKFSDVTFNIVRAGLNWRF